MNNEARYYLKQFLLNYYTFRYSVYFPIFISLSLLLSGFLVFFVFVIPEMQNWFSIRSEVTAAQTRIHTIQQNTLFLQSLNRSDVENNFQTVLNAFPAEKDFVGILKAINKAATLSNCSLSEYSFSLGKVNPNTNAGSRNIPVPIDVQLTLDADASRISSFINEIEKQVPLVEIKSLNFANGKGNLAFSFYVKPLPKLLMDKTAPLPGLSSSDKKLINNLASEMD